MLPPLSNKLIAHLDMNSFFASVEQQANPTLRGQPLGVCAYLHKYGCIIAASIEAKRVGVHVGMTMEEARAQCAGIRFVENDPPKYRAVSSRVFSILQQVTDRVEIYSIDEAFLDLTGWYRDAAEAAWVMTKIRRQIMDGVGEWLRCSIGIAPTRFLAKTASDLEKPNGLVVINRDNLDTILSQLDLEDVCGIGSRTRRKLEGLGIRTLVDIKRYPVANLMRVFGKYGFYLWCRLHALEYESVRPNEETPPKTIGHSYCVPARVTREGRVVAVLTKLIERAGRRLRQEGLWAGTVSVTVGFRMPGRHIPKGVFWNPLANGGRGGFRYLHLTEPARDSFTFVKTACDLLAGMWQGEPVDFLAVTLSNFSVPNGQLSLSTANRTLFYADQDPKQFRERRVSDAVDRVRDRYGDGSIMFGSMLKLGDEAPDRIGFRKVTGLET